MCMKCLRLAYDKKQVTRPLGFSIIFKCILWVKIKRDFYMNVEIINLLSSEEV